ncbi:MAG: hypothetical protein HYX41_05085 [Bdellovibrio sp.]|nr:hypothetical protein [Bdellovibrio sp.]
MSHLASSIILFSMLTPENYSQGFLIDDELMAGVTQHPEKTDLFVAFVVQHSTGEYLGYEAFSGLNSALQAINQIPRQWAFEKVGGCGGCEGGKCGKGACSKKSATEGKSEAGGCCGEKTNKS